MQAHPLESSANAAARDGTNQRLRGKDPAVAQRRLPRRRPTPLSDAFTREVNDRFLTVQVPRQRAGVPVRIPPHVTRAGRTARQDRDGMTIVFKPFDEFPAQKTRTAGDDD